ncbi:hypothetical protein Aperf_G00000063572 [Anoplocephala perfoliata]
MAYEPVLAPTVMTGDSSLNVVGESGFKHYLRSISQSLTPSTTPTTPTTTISGMISTTFIVPQSEVVNGKVISANIDELKESPGCSIALINKANPGTMASVALAPVGDTDNASQENELSTSTISSSFDSPPFSSTNNVEEVGAHEPVKSAPEGPAMYRRKSQVNPPPLGGQTIGSILRNLFRRRANSAVRPPESPASQSLQPIRRSFFHSNLSLSKDAKLPQTNGHAQRRETIFLRSVEVSPIGQFNYTKALTITRNPNSPRPLLQTESVQSNYEKPCPNSAPAYLFSFPLCMNIGKVETVGPLTNASHVCKRNDSGIRQRTSVASVFINLETPSKSSRFVKWENKSTSPLTILPAFVKTSSKVNVVKNEDQPPEPASWHQDDPISTQLSTQVDLESDTSIESDYLYEAAIEKPSSSMSMNRDSQRSFSVCIDKSQSEKSDEFSSKSSAESSDSTMIQENGADLRGKERKNLNRLSIVNNPTAATTLPQPSPFSISKLQNHKDEYGKTILTEDFQLADSNTLDRQIRRQRTKTPPLLMLKRNRDIVNGVQKPLSPSPGSFRLKRKFSADESAINRSARSINKKLSQSLSLGYNQNDGKRSYLHRDRLQPLADLDITDDSTSFPTGVESPLSTPKMIRAEAAVYKHEGEIPYKTGQNSAAVEGDLSRVESQNTMSVSESNFHNSSESSGISVNFTSRTSANKSADMTSLSQLSAQIKQDVETSTGRKVSSVKVGFEAALPQPIEIVEPTSPLNGKPLNNRDLLTATNKSKQEEVKNAKGSAILIENAVTRPSHLPDESLSDTSSSTDSLLVQEETPTLESEKTPIPLSRLQTLTLKAEQEEEITPSYIPSCFSRAPLDTITSITDVDETPVPENYQESPSPSVFQFPDPNRTPSTTTCPQVTTKAQLNQIHFPKSTRKVLQPSAGAPSNLQTENCQPEESVLNSRTKKAQLKKPGGSTKLTRSSHVTKRPQTVSVTRGIEDGHQVFIIHPETRKDIKPECHFYMHEKLGVGKFGSVYRCENKQTHQILAMKEIKTDRLARHTTGDIMEVAVLRAIGHHENIVCLHSAYEVQHTCFIITEYVSGGALFDRVVSEDNLDEQISASIVRQMLLGLQHIQACSVLHLDLKPENVMMVEPTGYQLKIIDFGLAYFYDPKRPTRQMAGTYIYSAPETINYETQSFATDTWSVAVIAYELLSGITPFECPPPEAPDKELTMPEVTTNIIKCRYNFDDDGICDTSEEAKDFIRMILKRNPEDRPSVSECLEHPWMKTRELPKVRREVSIRRRASAKEKTRPFLLGRRHITTNNENF